MKKATIRDIAHLAEVSVATVSLVLNKRDQKISQTTREKVIQAAKSLNYKLNCSSLGTRLQRSNIIGLIIPSITNPYYTAIARGVDEAAQAFGFGVFLCSTYNNPAQEHFYIDLFLQKRVDGVILTSALNETIYDLLDQHTDLKILAFTKSPHLINIKNKVDFLTGDNIRGGYMAAIHLLELNHRKIAYIGHNLDRLKGFQQAFIEKGLEHDPRLVLMNRNEHELNVVIGEDVIDLGFTLTQKLLTNQPDITAIFAYNDLAALGAMMAAKELGLKIPEDISIIGYDDIPFAALSDPPLTTIEQPKYERGKDAVNTLVTRITGQRPSAVDLVYRPRLIIRKSTGPVRIN